MGCRKYILGYPVAGGKMDLKNGILDCVIFDRFMLEREAKTNVENYNNILKVFEKSAIKAEYPYDMLEWIWIHMALNAGVISTAAKYGNINDPTGAARTLMESTKALKETILSIREAMNIIKTRGVKLKNYRNELLSYYMPSNIAAILMKKMFKTNELSRKIMELHSNKNDLFYVCSNVYNTGKQNNVSSVNLYNNYEMYISHLLTNIDA
jgi:2-dehydropantoate 2-reductase